MKRLNEQSVASEQDGQRNINVRQKVFLHDLQLFVNMFVMIITYSTLKKLPVTFNPPFDLIALFLP